MCLDTRQSWATRKTPYKYEASEIKKRLNCLTTYLLSKYDNVDAMETMQTTTVLTILNPWRH